MLSNTEYTKHQGYSKKEHSGDVLAIMNSKSHRGDRIYSFFLFFNIFIGV